MGLKWLGACCFGAVCVVVIVIFGTAQGVQMIFPSGFSPKTNASSIAEI